MKLELVIKEMIRLNIKPNFSALTKENDCDYRTIKKKYEIQILKEKGIEIIEKSRDCLIDDYRNIINYKLETIPGIKA
ncbi:MAG: hypothetical protein RSG51_01795, partial [Bacilli bacterium]